MNKTEISLDITEQKVMAAIEAIEECYKGSLFRQRGSEAND